MLLPLMPLPTTTTTHNNESASTTAIKYEALQNMPPFVDPQNGSGRFEDPGPRDGAAHQDARRAVAVVRNRDRGGEACLV